MSDPCIKMITGLGNPGKEYSQTRHNMGFLVIDLLASQRSLLFNKSRFDAQFLKTKINSQDIFLVKPLSFMNRSGGPIQKTAAYFKIDIENILVIHDDLDLEFGKIKIVQNRGHGGHNGVRSVIDSFGSKNFMRLRLGVGRPGQGKDVTGHVLGGFSGEEKDLLNTAVENGVNACMDIVKNGVRSAMNIWNTAQ